MTSNDNDSRLWTTQREVQSRELQFQVSSPPKRYRVVLRGVVVFESSSVADAATRFSDLRDGRHRETEPGEDCLYPDCASLKSVPSAPDYPASPIIPPVSLLPTPGSYPSAPTRELIVSQTTTTSSGPEYDENVAKPKQKTFFSRLFQPFVKPKYPGNSSARQDQTFPKADRRSVNSGSEDDQEAIVAKVSAPEKGVPMISKPVQSSPVLSHPKESRALQRRLRKRSAIAVSSRDSSSAEDSEVLHEGSPAWKYRAEVLLLRDAIEAFSKELDDFRVKILEGDELKVVSLLRKIRRSGRSIRDQLKGFSRTFEVSRLDEQFERLKEKRDNLVGSEEVQGLIRSWKSRRRQSRTQARARKGIQGHDRSSSGSTDPPRQLLVQEALPAGVRLHVMTSAEVERLIEEETREEFEMVQREYLECLDLVTDMRALTEQQNREIDTIEDHVQQAPIRIERGRKNIRAARAVRKNRPGWLFNLFRK